MMIFRPSDLILWIILFVDVVPGLLVCCTNFNLELRCLCAHLSLKLAALFVRILIYWFASIVISHRHGMRLISLVSNLFWF